MTILDLNVQNLAPALPLATPASRVAGGQGNPTAEVVVEAALPKAATARPPSTDMDALRKQIALRIEDFLRDSGRSVEYHVDSSANSTVLTVRRADTGEVVRQYPTEEALALLRRLSERSGTLLEVFA
jgi:flagellar protein FlaG